MSDLMTDLLSTPRSGPKDPGVALVQRLRQGIVLKNKMQKTVVVEVTRRVKHGKYAKFVKRRLRYQAHDADNRCQVGDLVLLEECRPLSKAKRWRVLQILESATNI